MIAFLNEFLTELIEFVVLVAVAVAAVFCGKKLREKRDAGKKAKPQKGK